VYVLTIPEREKEKEINKKKKLREKNSKCVSFSLTDFYQNYYLAYKTVAHVG